MTQISLGAAFRDLFSTEKKWPTFWCLCLCQIIPVVGPIVMMGYLFQRFARVRNQMPTPDFNFNLFGEYLKFGLWPFLASLVMTLGIIPIMVLAAVPMMIAAASGTDNEVVIFICIGVSSLIYIFGICLMMVLVFPVTLRSGLMQDFKAGFSKSFIMSFIKTVGGKLVLFYILLMLISFPAMILGYIALFVGLYIVIAVMSFVSYHIVFQCYDLFLERGGERIVVDQALLVDPPPTPPLPQQSPPTLPSE